MTPKIVITGIGVISPLGTGRTAFVEGIKARQSVIRSARLPAEEDLGLAAFSLVDDFDPKLYIQPRKNIKLMCREVAMGVAAGQLAVDDAGLAPDVVDPERLGIVLGSEMLYGPPTELEQLYVNTLSQGPFCVKNFGQHIQELFPLWMLKYLPNMAACHLAIAQNALAHNNSVVQGDASSLLAIIEAMSVMQRGWADVMIAGGVGSMIQPVRTVQFDRSMFAQPDGDPSTSSRPFDKTRSGMVCGEGAATFVLETAEHAKRRGATPLATLGGFGRCFETARPTSGVHENGPSVKAIVRAMRSALEASSLTAAEVDHVNAHGLSTIENDIREAAAILEIGDLPVTAPKSYFGNLGAGGGAVELAFSVLAMTAGEVAPTLNFSSPDEKCPVRVISGEPKPLSKPAAIAVSHSTTGQAVALVVQQAS